MKISFVGIPGLAILEPRVFGDERGFFFESYNSRKLAELGIDTDFVQDNHSRSRKGVLRGLHYQVRQCQTKLVRVTCGEIFDVAVDLRKSSPTFGHWFGIRLSAENMRQFYIPGCFAHGYLVLSETADVLYKASDFYAPPHERCIRWNDPDLAIEWPLDGEPLISAKDAQGLAFHQAELPADAVLDCLLSKSKRSA